MPKTILVTGGSGFLGSHIVSKAQEKGYNVLAPRSSEFNLETGAGIKEYMEQVKQEHGGVDTIIHSAAYYGGIGINKREPATIFNKNIQMALNVFEVAREHEVAKVLPIGSACAYPGKLTGNLKEDDFWEGKLHETVEAYGISKKIQLVGQEAYYNQYGITSNHLVLTNLYGPYDVFNEYRSHVLSALIKKFTEAKDTVHLWGDGSPIREFLYVDDAAEAITRAIEMQHDLKPVNIGTGEGVSIKELAQKIQRISGFQGDIEWDTSMPNGVHRKVLDVSRMEEVFDWRPRYSLDEGLRLTADWYVNNKAYADAIT
jgi:GDP-L-fucose synthase